MPRPEKERIVHFPPLFESFKPSGVPKRNLKRISLSLDEYEAVRLADFMGLEHSEAAEMMEISRSTFTRLIEKARKKTATMIVEGAELHIEGGNIHFRGNTVRCSDCNHIFRTGLEDVVTICPSCGSSSLSDLADFYGHGGCCARYGRMNGKHHDGGRRHR